MSEEMKCLRCGGTNLKSCDIQSTGKVYSCPRDANKLVSLLTTGAPISNLTCFDCGHVELLVDVNKAKALAVTA